MTIEIELTDEEALDLMAVIASRRGETVNNVIVGLIKSGISLKSSPSTAPQAKKRRTKKAKDVLVQAPPPERFKQPVDTASPLPAKPLDLKRVSADS